jgi:hypothetical protein
MSNIVDISSYLLVKQKKEKEKKDREENNTRILKKYKIKDKKNGI